MSKTSPGVVLVSKFITSTDSAFSGYINYIDRDSAVRNKHMEEYNTYMDYMGNPEKTSELFTATRDSLSLEEKQTMKEYFSQAQKNESLMWQSVFSFSNEWLEKYGVLNDGILDENKMKEVVRGAMNKMLEKEGIKESAMWSAAIHFNTDNIHVHIATTELNSLREKKQLNLVKIDEKWLESKPELKEYLKQIKSNRERQYIDRKYEREFMEKLKKEISSETGEKNRLGNWLTINKQGDLIVSSVAKEDDKKQDEPYMMNLVSSKMEYKGTWRESSLDFGKSFVVNKIIDQEKENQMLNQLMRDSILGGKKSIQIRDDMVLRNEFMNIYQNLPEDRRQWFYSSNKLGNENRTRLDNLSKNFIQRYFPEEMEEIKKILNEQSEVYKEAYGQGSEAEQYVENKLNDLYKRMGNSILKEMKNYYWETHKRTSTGKGNKSGGGSKGSRNSSQVSNSFSKGNNDSIEKSMLALKRYLEKDIDNFKNQAKYSQIEDEIFRENKMQNIDVPAVQNDMEL